MTRTNATLWIEGYCPMGCGRTLFLGEGGYVTCSFIPCPRPDAVADLLDDNEPEHIVKFDEETFTVRHPLRERLDDVLMRCVLHEWIASRDGPPVQPGKYRAVLHEDGWRFTALEQP